MLELQALEVWYGNIQALRGVTLKTAPGQIVALLGSNGAGKSTTLNAISGLLRPRSGRIFFQGRDITGVPAHMRARMGIVQVPEGRRIFAGLTVQENLIMSSYARGSVGQVLEEIDEVLAMFPVLKSRLKQRAGTLSGGEQQMLAIARALLARPKLLLLDEPSMGLAPMITESIFEAIASIRTKGVSILLVEQNARAALEVADYGYVLETGRIVLEGNSSTLRGDERVRRVYLGIES